MPTTKTTRTMTRAGTGTKGTKPTRIGSVFTKTGFIGTKGGLVTSVGTGGKVVLYRRAAAAKSAPARSNAGGAIKGLARAAQVKGLNATKKGAKGRVRTGAGGSPTKSAAAQRLRAVNAVTQAQRANTAGAGTTTKKSIPAGSSGVGIGFNAMVRRGAGNAIKAATGKNRKGRKSSKSKK